MGTNIIAYFTELGWNVTNFDNCKPRNGEQFTHWEEVDLLDRANLVSRTKEIAPSVFLHFGGRTDLDEKETLAGYAQNIEGVRNVIEAIRQTPSIQRAIFASSQLVCRVGYTPMNEFDYHPNTMYGRSKVLFERIIHSAEDLNFIWTIVRPTSLWGPWFGVPFYELFQLIRKNRYFHIKGVNPVKQWGFVGNTIYQLSRILEAPPDAVHAKTYYLADYSPVGLHEFTNQVQRRFGVKPIREIPDRLMKCAASLGDIAKVCGWKIPPMTSFRYQNIVTPDTHDLSGLNNVTGPLPFTNEAGIDLTVNWLSTH